MLFSCLHHSLIYPKAASIPEPSTGRYPLELAIESGKSYDSVIDPLIDAFPDLIFPPKLTEETTSAEAQDGSNNGIMIDRVYTSLSNALMNPSLLIRNEAVITVGCIVKRIAEYIDQSNQQHLFTFDASKQDTVAIDAKIFKVEGFMTNLIKNSDRSMNYDHAIEDPYSSAHFMTDTEWESIQSTMLRALSQALSNASPQIITTGSDLPKRALHLAQIFLRHENADVRESASCVLGTTLKWLQEDHMFGLLDQLLLKDYEQHKQQESDEKKEKTSLSTSIHSVISTHSVAASVHSIFSGGSSSMGSGATLRVSNSSNAGSFRSTKTEVNNMLKPQSETSKHGKALACLQTLLSARGSENIIKSETDLLDLANIIKELMLDDDTTVRKAACLAMGSIIGRSTNDASILKLVRRTAVKCMRSTEDEEVHIALVRGLMLAAHMKPGVFVCKEATPILEGALVLGETSILSVKKMFHGFLWLALGIGDKDSSNAGLSEYMKLAEGENGLIMMNLVTNKLARIRSIEDVLWLSN